MNSFVREDGIIIRLVNNKMFGVIRMIQFPDNPLNPWFAGVDVARSLGYSNPRNVVNTLPSNKMSLNLESMNWLLDNSRFNRRITNITTIIDQGGLYIMVMRSSLPKAEEFQRWIAYKVIPSIADGTINQISDELENDLSEFGIYTRKGQINIRNGFTSSIAENMRINKITDPYPRLTNAVYQGVLGRTASQLKEAYGDISEKQLRTKLRPEIRVMIGCAEKDMQDYIRGKSNKNKNLMDSDVDKIESLTRALYGNNPYTFDANSFPVHIFPFDNTSNYTQEEIEKMYDNADDE